MFILIPQLTSEMKRRKYPVPGCDTFRMQEDEVVEAVEVVSVIGQHQRRCSCDNMSNMSVHSSQLQYNQHSCQPENPRRRTRETTPLYSTFLPSIPGKIQRSNSSALCTPDSSSIVTTTQPYYPSCRSSLSDLTQDKHKLLQSPCKFSSPSSYEASLPVSVSSQSTSLSTMIFTLFVLLVTSVTCIVPGATQSFSSSDIFVKDYLKFSRQQNPHNINENVIIERNAKLVIEPGAIIQFAPRKGILVKGALIARGLPHQRITLTRIGSQYQSNFDNNVQTQVLYPNYASLTASLPVEETSSSSPTNSSTSPLISQDSLRLPDIRLVDGELPSEGRLQVKVNVNGVDIWHSVCTNTKNWTREDINVVCHQLGFKEGSWYRWFDKFNDSRQLMLEHPSCSGSEGDLRHCPDWASRQTGSGVCDYHADIGIRCSREVLNGDYFWSGLKFIEADHQEQWSELEGKMKAKISNSILEYLDITFAGESKTGKVTPAILSTGIPPLMNNMSIKWCLGTAINVTDATDAFAIRNSVIQENRGYGILVNSSWGQVSLNNIVVKRNGADGIRYNLEPDVLTGADFCKLPNLGDSQIYPVRITHDQTSDANVRDKCCQEFKIRNRDNENAQLTAHFPFMMSGLFEGDENDRHRATDGFIEVIDGYKRQLVSRFLVGNQTKIQSVTSTQSRLQICYHPAILKKVLFTVVIVADTGRAYDMNITRSHIEGNNGRGVWIQNQKSGVVLNHTLVTHHSYVAGLHVSSPSGGDVIVNNSQIVQNDGDGVNVTTTGVGIKHIDRSKILNNKGRGVAIFFNESSSESSASESFLHRMTQQTQVTFSEISLNEGVSLLIGNVCRSDSFVNISMNKFVGNHDDVIEIRSCLEKRVSNKSGDASFTSNIFITHNDFAQNHRLGLKMSPVVSVKKCLISHNNFRLHSRGVILINNQRDIADDSYYESLPVNIEVGDNILNDNEGIFVASLGLQEDSPIQSLLFTRNMLVGNTIQEPYPRLNPRSRVAAVVVVSSSNTKVIRNNLMNTGSKYEIGVHLESHSKVINASFNYYGEISKLERTHDIYDRIFDRKNRYNLAQVEFLQYRVVPYDLRTNELLSIDRERDKFIPFRTGQILGGEVRGDMNIEAGDYTVVRDIFVRPGSRLILSRGVVMTFDQSVGMMVQGKLESNGHVFYPIRFTGTGSITPYAAPTSRFSIVPSVNRGSRPLNHDIPSVFDAGHLQDSPVASHPLTPFDEEKKDNNNNNSTLFNLETLSSHPSTNGSRFYASSGTSSEGSPSSPFITSTDRESQKDNISSDNNNNNENLSSFSSTSQSHPSIESLRRWSSNGFQGKRKRSSDDPSVVSSTDNVYKVRLSKGTWGRLEVNINGVWGGVCSYGFDIEDAAVACQQMGFVLNQRDWLLETSQYRVKEVVDLEVIVSNLRCTHMDTDITQCRSEKKQDFLKSCPSDVGIKCFPPSWSGIRLGMAADVAIIEHTIIEAAGLQDYATYSFRPALQVDFHRHRLTNLTVKSNSDCGMSFSWNDIFTFDRDSLRVSSSQVYDNEHHGVITRSQGLKVSDCIITNNRGSGLHYDPMFSKDQQKDLISWVVPDDREAVIHFPFSSSSIQSSSSSSSYSPFTTSFARSFSDRETSSSSFDGRNNNQFDRPPLNDSNISGKRIFLDPDKRSFWYIRIAKNPPANFSDSFTLETRVEHGLGVMILNPLFGDSTDELIIANPAIPIEWDLRKNLSSFPMLNYAYRLKVNYSSGEKPKGNILLFVAVKRLPFNLQNYDFVGKERLENKDMKTIAIERTRFISNGRGITSNHYNRDIGNRNEYYHRHSNETIFVLNSTIEKSTKEAFFVNSPFYDPLEFSLAEINFTLVNCIILKNSKGIVQYSRDIRNSNNLFHWVINRTKVEENEGSGVNLRLPYVWQYNENFTHSIQVFDNDFNRNRNFDFTIDGYFARMNMSGNRFSENRCKDGLVKISGMEKEMKITHNYMSDNFGHFVVQFDIQSHADKFGVVSANFYFNVLRNNKDIPPSDAYDLYHPQSYTVAMRGVQFINITRNVFNNENLQFEFLAGVLTGSLENTVNVKENWWGTSNASKIRERILDFDDWNSYAIADFSPFLADEAIHSVSIPAPPPELFLDFSHHFGGRIQRSLRLSRRPVPYVVNSDLTVMPGAQLFLDAGVEMEFYPSVGILVLGELITAGTVSNPVIFKPHRMRDERYRFKRQDTFYDVKQPDALDLTDVKLCVTESCKEWYPSNKEYIRDGFLEVYNRTTMQWMSVCDPRFTERNAQVVCRQLGFSAKNVYLRRGKRLDVGPTLISRVRYWPEPLECSGHESSLSQCEVRLNGYGNHTHACSHDGENFVYVYCGPEFMEKRDQYWGGIRFASPSFEYKSGSIDSPRSYRGASSKLENTVIIGAGILHGEKNAALQMINRDVNLEYVNVSRSASHGIEAIAPSGHLRFHHLRVMNNLGSGINYLLLGGASTNQVSLPYDPLKTSTIPYNVFGLVNICDLNKNMLVEGRVLLYYKYDNRPVDCVKIFRSRHDNKQISFRIIQFNLFNSTNYAAVTDSIKLYDGDIFNQTVSMMADLGVSEKHRVTRPEVKLYSSSRESLSVRLHASGASETFGFVAEVVTLPVSYFLGRDYEHNITYSEISNNVNGAVTYKSAGETSPSLSIVNTKIENNCKKLYENFTTCSAALSFRLQNTQHFYFHNNLIRGNEGGGLRLEANAQSIAGSLKGLIINNLFDSNFNNEALFVKGPDSRSYGSYQHVEVLRNYFTHNKAAYKSNIVLSQVIANFTKNIVVANSGKHQLEVKGFKNILISYQTVSGNWFYNNFASHINEKATIYASSSGQHYVDNYFVNPDNDFELATMNRSCYLTTCELNNVRNIQSQREREEREREAKKSFIDARNNWWGFNETSAIYSRILDYYDYPDLVRVESLPFHRSNSTVLSGICSGGWEKIGHTCFAYIGARMRFEEAKKFCETQNSTMPFVRVNQRTLTRYLKTQQYNYEERFFKVWVQSFDYDLNSCTVLRDSRVKSHDCYDELPFFCEKDPEIHVDISFWYTDPLGITFISVTFLAGLLFFCVICCCLCKSREKAKEKLQRRNSVRASIRSNRSIHGSSMASSLNEIAYKRQQMEAGIGSSYSSTGAKVYPQGSHQPIQLTNLGASYSANRSSLQGSIDSFGDTHLYRRQPPHSVSYAPQGRHPTLQSSTQFVDSPVDSSRRQHPSGGSSSYRPLEDRFEHDPGLENANVDLMIRPTFDLVLENRAFKPEVTPSASRASGRDGDVMIMDYGESSSATRDWLPSSVSMDPSVSSPVRKAPPRPPVLPRGSASQQFVPPRSPSMASSIGQFSRASPMMMMDSQRFNTYDSSGTRNYERIGQKPVLSTFAPASATSTLQSQGRPQLPPARGSNGILVPPSKSNAVSMPVMDDGVASVTTNMTVRTKQSQYLETSLDGESLCVDNNYDYCDYRFRPDSVSISTVSSDQQQDKNRGQPLETAM